MPFLRLLQGNAPYRQGVETGYAGRVNRGECQKDSTVSLWWDVKKDRGKKLTCLVYLLSRTIRTASYF